MPPSPVRTGELIGQKLGKYELLALIAVGGTAEIYLARIGGAAGFEKFLVVKCLLDHLADDQEFVRMFLDEARVGAQLDHSNIVQTLELGEHEGRYFMAMEYLAGMSVAQMARKIQEQGKNGGLIDTDIVFGLAAQTCAGLHYAHERVINGKSLNLVHRDISPQNLVVSFEGILKIVDFGIAKSDFREAHTRTGTIKGKFAYMSPEQCLAKPVDRRTDIFALGTLCHELLTGRRLFKRQTTYDTYQAIVNGGVPPPSSINPKLSKDVDEVIMKALEYKKEDRYPTAQAFGEALLSLMHRRGASGGPGDVSRFFERHLSEQIDEHAANMRELITGNIKKQGDGTWDSEFGDGEVELSKVERTPTRDESKPRLSSAPTLDKNVDEDEDEDDEEGPTRIEFNAADRIAASFGSDDGVDESWDDETGETRVGGGASDMQELSLGASPMGADILGSDGPSESDLPPVPSAGPPVAAPTVPHRPDFAAPPETINLPLDELASQAPKPPAHTPPPPTPAPGTQGKRPAGTGGAQRTVLGMSPPNLAALEQTPLPSQPQGQQAQGSPPQGQQQLSNRSPQAPTHTPQNVPVVHTPPPGSLSNMAAQGQMGYPGQQQQGPGGMQRQLSPYPAQHPSGSYPAQGGAGYGGMTAKVPAYPSRTGDAPKLQDEKLPAWMHAVAFVIFAAIGVGLALLIKGM